MLTTDTGQKNAITVGIIGKGAPFQIYVFDPLTATQFQLPMPLLTGDRIFSESENYGQEYSYSIILKETKNQLNDGTCTKYPDSAGHDTYADCVQSEARKNIMRVLGCMPPWMSAEDQCNGPIPRPEGSEEFFEWFDSLQNAAKTGFFYESKSCLHPCASVSVHTIFREKRAVKNWPTLDNKSITVTYMYVNNKVQVDTLVPAVDVFTLIIEIGRHSKSYPYIINKIILEIHL